MIPGTEERREEVRRPDLRVWRRRKFSGIGEKTEDGDKEIFTCSRKKAEDSGVG